MSGRRRRSVAALVSAGAALLGACNDTPSAHVFSGRVYDATRDCVGHTEGIDVVQGAPPEMTCAPTCLVVSGGEDGGGASVVVSTMCAPYPAFSDASGAAPVCAAALAAYGRNATCLDDGGSSAPVTDAGVDGG